MAKVLVVGGAGYVGGATSAWLLDRGHEVWVLDNLSTGHRYLSLGSGFTEASAGDRKEVRELLERERFDCVMHFAAKSLVGESVQKPAEYFENNVEQTQALLETMLECQVRAFIFSSTCAIFGDQGDRDLDEDCPKNPINPYGQTKLEAEARLQRLAKERGLHGIALRYFNACGAEAGLRTGELHRHETHLIPNILRAAIESSSFNILGTDYPTRDGTCVRDYVHVSDLAQAHGAAMERILARLGSRPAAGNFEAFNLGTENGFTVREVLRACEEVTGRKIDVREAPRRPGDPPRLIGNSTRAKRELGYRPTNADLRGIISSALEWEKKIRTPQRAVFLDRDGTLNIDPGYLNHPDQMQLLPGVGEAIVRLKAAGYLIVVITNQSGVGRGLIEEAMIPRIHNRLGDLLAPSGARIDHFEMCFLTPEDPENRRKPKPDLIHTAARSLNIDLSRSYMIGDRETDIQAGRTAGCRGSLLVRTGDGKDAKGDLGADFSADSLLALADWILSQGTAGS